MAYARHILATVTLIFSIQVLPASAKAPEVRSQKIQEHGYTPKDPDQQGFTSLTFYLAHKIGQKEIHDKEDLPINFFIKKLDAALNPMNLSDEHLYKILENAKKASDELTRAYHHLREAALLFRQGMDAIEEVHEGLKRFDQENKVSLQRLDKAMELLKTSPHLAASNPPSLEILPSQQDRLNSLNGLFNGVQQKIQSMEFHLASAQSLSHNIEILAQKARQLDRESFKFFEKSRKLFFETTQQKTPTPSSGLIIEDANKWLKVALGKGKNIEDLLEEPTQPQELPKAIEDAKNADALAQTAKIELANALAQIQNLDARDQAEEAVRKAKQAGQKPATEENAVQQAQGAFWDISPYKLPILQEVQITAQVPGKRSGPDKPPKNPEEAKPVKIPKALQTPDKIHTAYDGEGNRSSE